MIFQPLFLGTIQYPKREIIIEITHHNENENPEPLLNPTTITPDTGTMTNCSQWNTTLRDTIIQYYQILYSQMRTQRFIFTRSYPSEVLIFKYRIKGLEKFHSSVFALIISNVYDNTKMLHQDRCKDCTENIDCTKVCKYLKIKLKLTLSSYINVCTFDNLYTVV